MDPLNDNSLVEFPSNVPLASSCMEKNGEFGLLNMTARTALGKEIQLQRDGFKIMMMDIGDETKKTHLTKVYSASLFYHNV